MSVNGEIYNHQQLHDEKLDKYETGAFNISLMDEPQLIPSMPAQGTVNQRQYDNKNVTDKWYIVRMRIIDSLIS